MGERANPTDTGDGGVRSGRPADVAGVGSFQLVSDPRRRVRQRATLYALIAFCTPLIGVTVAATNSGDWPTGKSLLGAAASGLGAMLVALRAFIDGTVARAEKS